MKNLLFVLLGLLIYPAVADLAELVDDKLDTNLWVTVGVPSYKLANGLTGRCTDRTRRDGVRQRDYFGCGKVNIFISDLVYGEGK